MSNAPIADLQLVGRGILASVAIWTLLCVIWDLFAFAAPENPEAAQAFPGSVGLWGGHGVERCNADAVVRAVFGAMLASGGRAG